MDFLVNTTAPVPPLSSPRVKANDTRQCLEEMVPNSGALVTQVSRDMLAGQPTDELAPLSRFPDIYQEARSLQHARQGRPIRAGFSSASPLDHQSDQLTAAPIRPDSGVPSFNTTEEEDKGEARSSYSIVETDWKAEKHGRPRSNRTGRPVRSRAWTCDECNRLRQLVETYPIGTRARWRHIAHDLDSGRTPDQCLRKWVAVLDPSLKKRGDPWTAQEDEVIVKYIGECKEAGTRLSWARLASMLPGRTDTRIRCHYVRDLRADDNCHTVT
ncbi:Myb-like DNA-binding domain [Carpediemonas membranifera]|uniref:Myb-like DNA-binding domain n=1 Tax=Carpediemonas membranifera TaxID=201153 RepID=A0A8J6ARR3_9EUKA|nr:Myb-like DNA-binding domain [Carpediemonas membranifera]|eukprot:KAG9392323.1 Myb-like DNA-binding domain [Carpediemonas membranifera]